MVHQLLSRTMAKEMVLDALLMAVWRRSTKQEIILHSDQGSQYGRDEWQRFCRSHNGIPRMSRRGHCYDNAAVESCFGGLKKAKIRRHIVKNRDIARAEIFDYIEVFYNRARHHQQLGNIRPELDEKQMAIFT